MAISKEDEIQPSGDKFPEWMSPERFFSTLSADEVARVESLVELVHCAFPKAFLPGNVREALFAVGVAAIPEELRKQVPAEAIDIRLVVEPERLPTNADSFFLLQRALDEMVEIDESAEAGYGYVCPGEMVFEDIFPSDLPTWKKQSPDNKEIAAVFYDPLHGRKIDLILPNGGLIFHNKSNATTLDEFEETAELHFQSNVEMYNATSVPFDELVNSYLVRLG